MEASGCVLLAISTPPVRCVSGVCRSTVTLPLALLLLQEIKSNLNILSIIVVSMGAGRRNGGWLCVPTC